MNPYLTLPHMMSYSNVYLGSVQSSSTAVVKSCKPPVRGQFAYFIIAMNRIVAERFILFVGTKILRLVDAGTRLR